MGVEASAQLSGLPTSLACQCCSKAGAFKFTFYRRSSCSPNPGSAGCQLSWSQRLVALCIPRCGCRTPCFSDVGLCGGGSGHRRSLCCTFCLHRSRSEATQGVSLSHVSEHALIPWAVPGYNFMVWVSCVVGESVMFADTRVSAHSSRLMPTPGAGMDLSERFGGRVQ